MATDDLVKTPEQLEEEERLRQLAAAPHMAVDPVAAAATGEDRARMLKQAGEQPVGAAPEVTGLRKIAPAAGELPVTAPKQLPNLTFKERQALPTVSPGVPAGSSGFYRNEIERIEDQKRNPWGSPENRPGVLGKIGHVLGKIGNVAGDITGATANVPGTDLYNRIEEARAERGLGQAETRESEAGLRSAQQRRAEVETEEKQKQLAKNEQTLEKDAQGNVVGWKDNAGLHSMDAPETPQGIKDIADATANKLVPQYKTNETTGEVYALKYDPNTGKTSSEVVYKGDPKVKTETKTILRGGVPHEIIFDVTNPMSPNFGKELKDLGQTKLPGESPESKADEKLGKVQDAHTGRIDKMSAPITQRLTRLDNVTQTLKLRTAEGDAIVAPELLSAVVGGLGSGLRMSEAEIGRVVGGRDAWEGLKARLQQITPGSGQSLTDTQRGQMQAIIDAVKQKANQANDILDAARLDIVNAGDESEVRHIYADTQKKLSALFKGGGEGGGHSFTYNGTDYENVPDEVYQKYKGKLGFKEK